MGQVLGESHIKQSILSRTWSFKRNDLLWAADRAPSMDCGCYCCWCNLITTDILFTPNISGILAIFEFHSIFILIHSIIPLGNYIFVLLYSRSCFLELRESSSSYLFATDPQVYIRFCYKSRRKLRAVSIC